MEYYRASWAEPIETSATAVLSATLTRTSRMRLPAVIWIDGAVHESTGAVATSFHLQTRTMVKTTMAAREWTVRSYLIIFI